MKFRPCIDIHKGQVKQIVGRTLRDDTQEAVENFVADKDAAYFAEMYKRDGLTGGHVIMLGPGNKDQAKLALKTYPQGLQVGGGINPEHNAAEYLEAGASHVIVTSYVFKDGRINEDNLVAMVKAVGPERLVLDLSCRERNGTYFVVTNRWQKFTDFEVNTQNLSQLANYCAEFLVHGADVEGQCKGIQEDLVERLGEWANQAGVTTPMTYAGGIKSLENLNLINKLGNGKLDFTVGSALDIFGGKLLYRDIVNWRT